MRHSRLRQIKHRMNVDVECHPPFVVADLANLIERGLMSGVVNEDVQAPKFIDGALNEGSTVNRVPNVASDQNDLATFLFDQRLDFFRVTVLVKIGDQ